ncbi:hypothetical protein [Streptomyces tibetensis]|uniref:hypothetical protein n=1 Tax=Streptomyces tibetensis TaxID=2382123 RepID=UPI0033C741BF
MKPNRDADSDEYLGSGRSHRCRSRFAPLWPTKGYLTPGQRDRVTRFLADLPAGALPPTFRRLPSGIVLAEARVPSKAGEDLHETHGILMGPSGEAAKPQPGDL